jgi:hypothetical protein
MVSPDMAADVGRPNRDARADGGGTLKAMVRPYSI